MTENETGFELIATDEDGNVSVVKLEHSKERTKTTNPLKKTSKYNWLKQDFTPYTADEISVIFSENWFYLFQKSMKCEERFTNNYRKFV